MILTTLYQDCVSNLFEQLEGDTLAGVLGVGRVSFTQ